MSSEPDHPPTTATGDAAANAGARPRLLATCALHVDTSDPASALAAVRRLAAEDGFDVLRLEAKPYTKLGAHCRVTFLWRMPETGWEEAPVLAALSALCRAIGGAAAAERAHAVLHRHDEIEPGTPGFHAERIMDARRIPFARAEFLWVDIDVNTDEGAQADLRERAAQDETGAAGSKPT